MDPFSLLALVGLVSSIGGIGALLRPLLRPMVKDILIKGEGEKPNIKISIIGSDGSIKSIKFASSKSKRLSEAEIKKLIELLKEAK